MSVYWDSFARLQLRSLESWRRHVERMVIRLARERRLAVEDEQRRELMRAIGAKP